MQSDAELVKAVLNGSKEAFAVLVKRYERSARAAAMEVLGDYHFAADISQDAFVTAYENLPALRKPQAFGSWLIKITHRCALDATRRKPKETPLESTTAARLENPDGRLDEEKNRLLAAVLKLPKAEKQVVILHYFSGHKVRDVAAICSRSIGTVTKQLSRARNRLRNILKES